MKRSLLLLNLFLCSLILFAQNATLKGKVITTDGQPAPYVNVDIQNTKKMTYTDESGVFVFDHVKQGTYTITVSHAGLQSQTKNVELTNGQTIDLAFTLHETAKELDEVVVNGNRAISRKPTTLGKAGLAPLDNPQSVGTVSSTVITDQQALRLGDVVKNVSGVSLTQQRQGAAETFSARGYSIGIGGGSGGIFKNGTVVNTAGFPEASTLESVEVLKGSSALLYGNTSGGVIINMVTKKPKFNWGGSASMAYGNYDLYKPTIDVYGPIGKNLAFRLIGTYENAKSFRDQVTSKRTYVNPSLLYNLGKKTTILVQGDYLHSNFTPDYGIGIINNAVDVIIPASRSRFINTNWAYYKLDQSSGNITIDHSLNDYWKLNFIAAVANSKVDAYGTNTATTVLTNGNWGRSLARTKTTETDYTMQANLNGKFSTGSIKHQLLVGTDYVAVRTTADGFKLTNAAGVVGIVYDTINILNLGKYAQRTDIPTALDTSHVTSPSFRLGYYAQDLITLANKFKLLVGLRWSYQKTQLGNTQNYVLQNARVTGTVSESRALSPKVALIYQPSENNSVYASYTNNFNANSGYDVNFNALPASLVDQYEVGMKNIFLNGKLNANLSIYRIINSNLAQVTLFKADGATPNTDANMKELTGQTTSDGFDIDVNGNISKNFYFIAGLSVNNARYTKSTGIKGAVVEGEKLNNNPQQTANGTIFYTFDSKAFKGLKIGLAGFYTGKRYGGNQNTVGQTPVYDRRVPLTGFTTVDISAGYGFKKISILAKLSNVGNTLNYYVHDRYSINPIPPRQFMTTLSYRF